MPITPLRSPTVGEAPLNRATRFALVLGAAATILLFYVAAIAAMALLVVVVCMFFALTIGVARFGISRYVVPHLTRETRLLRIIGRNFWWTYGPTFRITLQPEEAPRLFAILKKLSAHFNVEPPHEVAVEMNHGAWVELEGYGRGAGKTILGLGYDLLAGLSEGEVEAVLAHELAHARLVHRGMSHWLRHGLSRLSRLGGDISGHAEACRRAKQGSDLADALARGFEALGGLATRLVATYSRQHEFEADRKAAEVCGAQGLRSSLLRLDPVHEAVARLPWNERVARVHPGDSFSEWLTKELARDDGDREIVFREHEIDLYSTHPALRDRLAALPADGPTVLNQRPGIELFAEPDRIAERLMAEIHRVTSDLEEKNTKELAKGTRKFCVRGRMQSLELLGGLLIVVGLITGTVALEDHLPTAVPVTALMAIAIGVVVFRRGRYRDRTELPVPAFGALESSQVFETAEEADTAERQIEDELRKRIGSIPKKGARVAALIADGYAALGMSHYLRAYVATKLALELDGRSAEAGLGAAVAFAGLGDSAQARQMLRWFRTNAGLRTRNTKLATAWALSLLDDWGDLTEGLFAQLHDMYPNEATFASMLALAQFKRGKLQSAARNAEKGCALDDRNTRHVKLLVHVLLSAGRAREAAERLKPLEVFAPGGPDVVLLLVRTNLMLFDVTAAREWAKMLRTDDDEGRWLVSLGKTFESARIDDEAAALYDDALSQAFYPEAHLGLARLEAAQHDRQRARAHLLSAINYDLPIPVHGARSADFFHRVLAELASLGDRTEMCTRWIAKMPLNEAVPLSGRSLMICAPTRASAEGHLQIIISAISPSAAPLVTSMMEWQHAPKNQQPTRPMHAGVERIVA